jgi:lambda family phage minor tail protein L
MAGEGKNQVASSLLDLQPTAVLEFFQIFPDPVTEAGKRLNFHGGTLFGDVITWQGVQYIPAAMESDGFETFGDKRLARPKIRISNKNNQITRLLQLHSDLVNAEVVRKKTFVRYLDDVNFDGGNPFGTANADAEISSETWVMGQKLQENKVFVEFELNSPLDLETFDVNYRSIIAKYCYWQYRGEGCRYEGLPIEKSDGEGFTDPTGGVVVPVYRSFSQDPLVGGTDISSFFTNPDAEYAINRAYQKGDVVIVTNNKISIQPYQGYVTDEPVKLKTVYVCVSGNSGEAPENNPTYWQQDGCTKKLGACRKRFNETEELGFYLNSSVTSGFNYLNFSGTNTLENADGFADDVLGRAGIFYSNKAEITGIFTATGEWTVAGWVNANNLSSEVAGILSTTKNTGNNGGLYDFLNITFRSGAQAMQNELKVPGNVGAFYRSDVDVKFEALNRPEEVVVGPLDINVDGFEVRNDAETLDFGSALSPTWYFYAITNEGKGTLNPDWEDPSYGTRLRAYVGNGPLLNKTEIPRNRFFKNQEARDSDGFIPQHFMLGGIPYNTGSGHASMNGELGPWAIWNRSLNDEEIDFLYKDIENPKETPEEQRINFVPRPFHECTGQRTGVTGIVNGSGLIGWWDMTTGDPLNKGGIDGGYTGLVDKSENNYFLTGSGFYNTGQHSFVELDVLQKIKNPSSPYPRFGGYPGTDGFGYGQGVQA